MSGDGNRDKVQSTDSGQEARDLQQKLQAEAASGLRVRNPEAATQVGSCSLKDFPAVNSTDGGFIFVGVKSDGASAQCATVGVGYNDDNARVSISKTRSVVSDPAGGTSTQTDSTTFGVHAGKKN